MAENKSLKIILWLGLAAGIIGGLFWPLFPIVLLKTDGLYYIGIAIFMFCLALCNYLRNRNCLPSFLAFSFTFSNLIDELFFNNEEIGVNEIMLIPIVFLIWIVKCANKNDNR